METKWSGKLVCSTGKFIYNETLILTHMETNTYDGKLVNSSGKFIDWGKLVHSGGKCWYEKSLTAAQVGCFMLVEGLFTQVKRLFTEKKLNFCPATMFTEEESLFTAEIISHVLTLFMKHLPTLAGKSRQSCSSRRKVLKTQATVAVISFSVNPKLATVWLHHRPGGSSPESKFCADSEKSFGLEHKLRSAPTS